VLFKGEMMASSNLGKDPRTGEDVFLSIKERLRGLYCLGTTGTGKTTLLVNLILQDIEAGRGLCHITPVGDAIKDILSRIPPEREKDVILFNPMHTQEIPGLNIFECPDSASVEQVALTSGFVMNVFERLWDVGSKTPQLSDVLRNLTITLIGANLTMQEILMLLTDSNFRSHVVKSLRNDQVKWWWQDYNNLKPIEQRELVSSTLNKVRAFLTNPLIARIISIQSTINMRRVMDEGKILLVELDPRLGDIALLLGSVIIARILEAAYSRAEAPQQQRRLFALYVDEFQQYATDDMATLLFEARKFGIATTIAHQVREGQLTDKMKGATLNAANIITLQISSMDAEIAGIFDTTPQVEVTGREEILVPRKSVRTHLLISGHQSSKVMDFTTNYIVPLNRSIKEEILEYDGDGYPATKIYPLSPIDHSYRFDPKDIEKGLDYLNEFLYLSMTHNHEEAKKAFYQAAQNFSGYFAFSILRTGPTKQSLTESAKRRIAKVQEEINEKKKVLENDETFFIYCVNGGYKEKWYKEIGYENDERFGTRPACLRTMLYAKDLEDIHIPTIEWKQEQNKPGWYQVVADFNKLLGTWNDAKALVARHEEIIKRLIYQYSSELEPLKHEVDQLWRKVNGRFYKYVPLEQRLVRGRRIQDLEERIKPLEEKIKNLNFSLTHNPAYTKSEAERYIENCQFFAQLDTAEKVREHIKQAYIMSEINPLLRKIDTINAELEKSLQVVYKLPERDVHVQRYEAFYNAAMSAALELEADPIFEGSGAYRDITRQVQTYSDRQHGIANTLTHLARFKAWAKLGNSEYELQTRPLPPRNKVKLSDLFSSIRRRNVEEGYLRPVSEVEAEIRARQEKFTQHLTSKQRV
jgi:hypothetical protein